ncbi:putative Rare lipoprotein B [Acidithiobacillus ferrivorans]|uniref:Rare lipoprotein B n=1 Tax=Acidithiobacillus ferrivorans TaxID=160808 RepID=A0A060UMD0_9PROT|nr:LPS assembly lipoprotein LptE [Acidithiobacillus ferrivorans]CDQ09466.1 putative Rare lipoprotein B [Acidithiobacillus ferrivorans]SMH67285.1 putative Rare lipoprotein B [Acidithiobacillus ferrivorans]
MNRTRQWIRWWLVAGLALVLGGCGFHLQTGATIPSKLTGLRVAGTGPSGGTLAQAVDRALQRDGNYAQQGGPLLQIDNAYVSQRIISISPGSGVALEFLDTLHADISVIGSDHKILLASQPLLMENSFSYNSGNPLATNEQQVTSQRLLMEQGARQILRRVLNSPVFRQQAP